MTNEEGIELNRAVAEKVMGWHERDNKGIPGRRVWANADDEIRGYISGFEPAINMNDAICAATKLIEENPALHFFMELDPAQTSPKRFHVTFQFFFGPVGEPDYEFTSINPAEAISRAALILHEAQKGHS